MLDTELYSLADLEEAVSGELAEVLSEALDALSELARESRQCKRWLAAAERGARISGEQTRLRVEEKLLYRSLLGAE